MAFNIRKYLGLDGTPGVIAYNNTTNPIPPALLDRVDKDINELIGYIVGAKSTPSNKPPATVKEFNQSINDHINESGFGELFPPGHPLPAQIAEKAFGILNDPNAILNSPADVEVRAKNALYDVFIYCDDSLSMQQSPEGRIGLQQALVRRICDVMLPFHGGVSLRLINAPGTWDNINTADEVVRILGSVPYNQYTPIGTQLESKILKPYVYDKIAVKPYTIKKPVLVFVITDGWPYGEDDDVFKNVVLRCQAKIKDARKKPKLCVHQVNQIGSDANSEKFIRELHEDPALKDVVYCTSDKLENKVVELANNKKELDKWIMKTLFPHIK